MPPKAKVTIKKLPTLETKKPDPESDYESEPVHPFLSDPDISSASETDQKLSDKDQDEELHEDDDN